MAPATRFRSNSPPVIQETIDGETIMVNLDTGSYYWLDPLASYISGVIQAGASLEELVADMTERFPDDPIAVEPLSADPRSVAVSQIAFSAVAPGTCGNVPAAGDTFFRRALPFSVTLARFAPIREHVRLDGSCRCVTIRGAPWS